MNLFNQLQQYVTGNASLHFADNSASEQRLDIVGHIAAERTGKVMEIDELYIEFRILLQDGIISLTARYQDTESGDYIEQPLSESDEQLLMEEYQDIKDAFLATLPEASRDTVKFLPGLQ